MTVTAACRTAPPASDELQAMSFLAGTSSIFHGVKLLTAGNPEADRDEAPAARLGLKVG